MASPIHAIVPPLPRAVGRGRMAAGGSDETMSDTHAAAQAADDHGHDDHANGGMGLGPFDYRMWAVGIVGVVAALVITAAFVAATGFQFNA